MKRYKVTIWYANGRENSLIVWASDTEEAERLAFKSWGNPDTWVRCLVEDTQYLL